jgi:hypothetical protein
MNYINYIESIHSVLNDHRENAEAIKNIPKSEQLNKLTFYLVLSRPA